MIFNWSEAKDEANRRKHRVSFETAQLAFDDPLHVSRQDRVENGEPRWQTIGLVRGVLLLLVAHTYTEADGQECVRIISARKADKTERAIYEQGD
jgi:uncharacterized DUF497 family protein